MRTFYASGFFTIVRNMAKWSLEHGDDAQEIASEFRKAESKAYASYVPVFSSLGLSGSKATLEKFMEAFKNEKITYGDIIELSNEFIGRIVDETKDKTFFSLTLRESELYQNPRQGWDTAIKRLPHVGDDIEEAYKCFALSRYAAAVFHSVQVVEAGLIELGIFLKVSDPKSGWTAVSKALSACIQKPHKDRSRFERKNFAFLEQMHGTVEALKNAWRNKISHSHGKLSLMTTDFSPEVAEEILIATRGFMRRLTEGLPDAKAKRTVKK